MNYAMNSHYQDTHNINKTNRSCLDLKATKYPDLNKDLDFTNLPSEMHLMLLCVKLI